MSDLAPGVTRCVGAFRRTCLILTDTILCDACWAEVLSRPPRERREIAKRRRLTKAGWERAREGRG